MLSLMLAFGIVSRIASGWIADHLARMATLFGMALGGWMSASPGHRPAARARGRNELTASY